MAIFGKKKTEETVKASEASVKPAVKSAKKSAKSSKAEVTVSSGASFDTNHVIIRPRITEKATVKADTENVYVFEIAKDANKTSVARAVERMYKVRPLKVAIATNPAKRVFYRGKSGVTSGVKKAYVYIKKGEKIEIV